MTFPKSYYFIPDILFLFIIINNDVLQIKFDLIFTTNKSAKNKRK